MIFIVFYLTQQSPSVYRIAIATLPQLQSKLN